MGWGNVLGLPSLARIAQRIGELRKVIHVYKTERAPFARNLGCEVLEPRAGIEPATSSLQNWRSTN